ncbi:MAG: transglutaminase-like cysteine peptidase [Candidatus Sedimenticola sp. (ex Thyasira tokunagai)]
MNLFSAKASLAAPVVAAVMLFSSLPCFAFTPLSLTDSTLNYHWMHDRVLETYGGEAINRLHSWRQLVQTGEMASQQERLLLVNRYFNRFRFVPDGMEGDNADPWSTPLETLTSREGDCEDLAIGKYYTLLEMGVPASQLRILHVRLPERNEDHMVVAYYPESGKQQAVILDNVTDYVGALSTRTDLLPVYSFNDQGVWIVNPLNGAERPVKQRIHKWDELRATWQNQLLPIQTS